jgi:hypothetical protein
MAIPTRTTTTSTERITSMSRKKSPIKSPALGLDLAFNPLDAVSITCAAIRREVNTDGNSNEHRHRGDNQNVKN